MTRADCEAECERRRRLVEGRCILQFSAYFAQRKLAFSPVLRKALQDLSRESCRVGDLCAFERANAGAGPFLDEHATPAVEYK